MHEYYQKSSGKLKKTMRGFLSLVRLELERITKQPYETAFEEIWRIYEHDMLGRFRPSYDACLRAPHAENAADCQGAYGKTVPKSGFTQQNVPQKGRAECRKRESQSRKL